MVDKKDVNIGSLLNIQSTCQMATKLLCASVFEKGAANRCASSNKMNMSASRSELSCDGFFFENVRLLAHI